jgi:4-hydroxy-3-polyprenylbenzoate decarboxylase
MNSHPRRLIVGITGASGAIYGVRLLKLLQTTDIETHLVMSRSAKITLTQEMDIGAAEVSALASVVHPVDNIGASIASGSFRTMGMVIAPCSMRSLAEIAAGVTSSLVTRAADVVLKDRPSARDERSHRDRRNRLPARAGILCAPNKPGADG